MDYIFVKVVLDKSFICFCDKKLNLIIYAYDATGIVFFSVAKSININANIGT
jgi:hypothetical protein